MENPRYWSKELRLPCALEHAVLRSRIFERRKAWRTPLFRLVNPTEENSATEVSIENGLVIPSEDPLLVAFDRVRQQQDEAAEGNAVLRCWAALVEGNDLDRSENDNDERETLGEKESTTVDEWPPSRDSLVVFELFDGVLTVADIILSGVELVGE